MFKSFLKILFSLNSVRRFLLVIALHVELYFQRPPGTRVLDSGLGVLERVHLRQQFLWLNGAGCHRFQCHRKVTASDGVIQTKHVRNFKIQGVLNVLFPQRKKSVLSTKMTEHHTDSSLPLLSIKASLQIFRNDWTYANLCVIITSSGSCKTTSRKKVPRYLRYHLRRASASMQHQSYDDACNTALI